MAPRSIRSPRRLPGVFVLCGLALLTSAAWTAPADAQDLKSSIDAAGASVDRQLGEWFGVAPPRATRSTRKNSRQATARPAQVPLPPRRPEEARAQAASPETEKPAPAAVSASAESADVKPSEAGRADSRPVEPKPATPTIATAPAVPPVPPESARADNPAPPTVTPTALAPAKPARKEAHAVPLPPSRPAAPEEVKVAALPALGSSEEPAEAPVPPPVPQKALIPTICPELSNEDLGAFTPQDVTTTQLACTVDRGVTLSAVRMKDGRMVKLEPAALLRCEMAAAVAVWIRDEVDPLVATLGSKLKSVKVAGSQQCRPRNRVAGAKISEHGRGNALDTGGYVLEDGRQIEIGGKGEHAMPRAFQEKLKASACAGFTTILGPGSDGYHEEHLHVDRAFRRSGAVLCQWAIAPTDKAGTNPAATPNVSPDAKADTKPAPEPPPKPAP